MLPMLKQESFYLTKDMTSFDIVRAMKSNVPVKLAFNNQETLGKLAERIASQMEPDSVALLRQLLQIQTFLKENGFT